MKQLSHCATLGDAADGLVRGVEMAGPAWLRGGRLLQPAWHWIDAMSEIPICLLVGSNFVSSGFLTGRSAIDVSKARRSVSGLKDNIGVLLIERALSTL
jgi:hypothetical protein